MDPTQPSGGQASTVDGGVDATALSGRDGEALRAGDRVGRYLILARVGVGGMGVVYSAWDPELERRVALKLMRASTDSTRAEQARQRLVREAKAMARLAHPGVVTVFDAGPTADGVFVAMEFVDGETLTDWLAGDARGWEEILDRFESAGDGLAAAHAAGLIHRDFKPDNVMIGRDGRVRVLDFGLARAVGDEDASAERAATPEGAGAGAAEALTRTGAVMGTPRFMAPEQHLGRSTDARTDQFSFAVSLYEALYRQRPFAGDTLAAIAFNVVEGRLRPPPARLPGPRGLLRTLRRAMAADPDHRWTSMTELLGRLRRDRRAPRRRLVVLSSAVVAVAVVAAVARSTADAAPAMCDPAALAIGEAWSAARQESLRDAMVATGLPAAPVAWKRFSEGVDRWVETWNRQRVDACEATNVLHVQSAEMLDRRTACLERHRHRLDALLAELASPDAAVVERLPMAAPEAATLTACADTTTLASRVEPPADAQARERIEELRRILDRAQAMQELGRYRDALAATEAIAPEAESLAYRPLIAEVGYRRGELQRELGDAPAAERSLTSALVAARESGDDESIAAIEESLVFVVGHQLGRTDEGRLWARLAAADLARIRRLPTAALASALGTVAHSEGEWEEAVAQFQSALELARSEHLDELRVASLMVNLAAALEDAGHPERSLPLLHEALEIQQRELDPGHAELARTYLSLGGSASIFGDMDEVGEHFRHALAIAEAAYGPESTELVMYLNNMASYYEEIGTPEAAGPLYQRAVALFEARGDSRSDDLALVLTGRGSWLVEDGQVEAGIRDLDRAIETYEALGNSDAADAYAAKAGALLGLGRTDEGLQLLEHAIEIAEADDWTAAELASHRYELALAREGAGRRRDTLPELLEQAREGAIDEGARGKRLLVAIDELRAKVDGSTSSRPPP